MKRYITTTEYIRKNYPYIEDYINYFKYYAVLIDQQMKQKYDDYKPPLKNPHIVILSKIRGKIADELRKQGYIVANPGRAPGTEAMFIKVQNKEKRYILASRNAVIRGKVYSKKARKLMEKALKKKSKKLKEKYSALASLFDMKDLIEQNLEQQLAAL